jgi:hypothetical protein
MKTFETRIQSLEIAVNKKSDTFIVIGDRKVKLSAIEAMIYDLRRINESGDHNEMPKGRMQGFSNEG